MNILTEPQCPTDGVVRGYTFVAHVDGVDYFRPHRQDLQNPRYLLIQDHVSRCLLDMRDLWEEGVDPTPAQQYILNLIKLTS